MKVVRITENVIENKCIVYVYNKKTHNEILLWDYSNGSFDNFVKWYGLPLHCKYEYCRIR